MDTDTNSRSKCREIGMTTPWIFCECGGLNSQEVDERAGSAAPWSAIEVC
jgi:hypothetical protein